MMDTTRRHTTVIGLFSWLMGKFWLTLRPQSAVAQHTLWKTHFSNGLEAYRRADYDEAKEKFEAGYEAAHQAVCRPDVVDFLMVTTLNNLLKLHQEKGNVIEAEALAAQVRKYFEEVRVAEGRERHMWPVRPNLHRAIMHLVTLYHTQHKHYETERTPRRLLATHKNVLFWQLDLDIADIFTVLASTSSDRSRYDEATMFSKAALTAWEKALGSEHPDVVVYIENLSALYLAQGQNEKATLLTDQALSIQRSAAFRDKAMANGSGGSTEGLYDTNGRYVETVSICEKFLVTTETELGPKHLDIVGSLEDLAKLYHTRWVFSDA